MRFTKPNTAGLELPEGKSDYIVFDDVLPGFGIRLRAGGKRTWIVQYRVGRRQSRMTIGSAAVLDLEQARKEARRALAKVGLGTDPQAEKDRARAEATLTMGSLLERYLGLKEAQLRPSSFRETRRYLLQAWAPLHWLPINSIGRADVAAILTSLSASGAAVAADRARAALSAFFTWAMKEGIAAANPVVATNRPAAPRARERVLNDKEVGEIWRACREDDFGRIVRLLLLTGQRREEVGGMCWAELDLPRAVWSIPGSRTKNGRPHDVPLTAAAMNVVAAVHPRHGRDLLFGDGAGAFSGWSRAKVNLDQRIQKAADPALAQMRTMPWRLHDIRRTVATGLGDRAGTQPHIVEAVLNHISGSKAGVAGVYNRAAYAAEKRIALDRWGEYVLGLVPKISPDD